MGLFFRLVFLISAILFGFVVKGQKLIDRVGYVRFFSEAPLENIEAVNNQSLAAIDLSNGKIAVSMTMSQFQFDKSLMQEHFNENYMESEKYPKGTFTGALAGFNYSDLEALNDSISYKAVGEISLHGVTRPHESIVWLKRDQNLLTAHTSFVLNIADFDIDIPKMVVMNIAEQVEVTSIFKFDLQEK